MSNSQRLSGDSAPSNVDLDQVFAASRSALCILRGPEHRWEKVNPVYQDLIFPGIDLIGRTVREVLPDVDLQGFGALLDNVYMTGQPHYGQEIPLQVHDRPPIYFNFVYAPIHDAQGAVSGIFVEAHDVTAQVLTRQALEEAEANYRSIVEHAAEGIFRTSPDGRLLLINPAFARIFGYASAEEMHEQITHGVEQMYVEPERRSELLRLLAHQDEITEFVIKARHKTGTFIWVSLSVHVLRNPDGSVREIEGIVEDITERQRAEEAVRTSEARYRAMFEQFPNGAVFLFDHDLRYTLASGTGLAASGLSPEIFEGKTLWEVFPPDIAARDEPHLRAALRGEATRVEAFLGARTFLVHTRPVKDAHDAIIGGMVMTQDITERKRAEEHQRFLAEASAGLSASLEYDTTLQNIACLAVPILGDRCIVFIVDADGMLHPAAAMDAGPLSEEEERVRHQHVTIAGTEDHPVAVAIRTRRPVIAPVMREAFVAPVDHVSGDERIPADPPPTHIIMPLIVRDEVLGAIMLRRDDPQQIYDVTAHQLAEDYAHRAALALEHARLYRNAQDALRTRDEFLSIAAHELKTPLTTLLGSAEVLQQRITRAQPSPLSERDQRTLAVIVEQSQRLQRQIDTFLDLSQIASGRLEVNLKPMELCSFIQRAVDEIQVTLERHQVSFRCAPASVMVQGDELRLDQVLQNLLQNAVKYSPAGGAITVRVMEQGTDVSIAVTDPGIGIPPQEQARLFERFYRAENATRLGIRGLGIGLAVTTDIIARHGGRLEVASVEGKGSTFTVWLPAYRDAHACDPANVET